VKIPNAVHLEHPWLISEIVPDFRLLDVWELPAEGGRDDFDSLLELAASFDPASADSTLTRVLVRARFRLGDLLGWDDATKERSIPDATETTLIDRLPPAIKDAVESPTFRLAEYRVGRFVPLYRTDNEWAAEVSNETVHGVIHLAWVDQGGGRYRGRLAVYAKPRGLLGEFYLKLIEPFRHWVVYPALMRQIERMWLARDSSTAHRAQTV
jgi:hypothetical protein